MNLETRLPYHHMAGQILPEIDKEIQMRRVMAIVALIAVVATSAFATVKEEDAVKAEIIKAVENAYINGVFIKGDAAAMKKGWHADSTMYINADGQLRKWAIKNWIKSIEQKGAADPTIKYEFPFVKYTENTAVVKVHIHQKGKHKYSDYLTLYKFKDGWKIIAKTYNDHDNGLATAAEDKELIKKAVIKGYVNGMFVSGDVNEVKSGWDAGCIVNVYNPRKDAIRQMPITDMFKYFENKGESLPTSNMNSLSSITLATQASSLWKSTMAVAMSTAITCMSTSLTMAGK
jgi:hypothetical protein